MKRSVAIPIVVVLAFLALASAAIWLAYANGDPGRASIGILMATGVFALIGATVVARRPGNLIGWLFITIGLVWAIGAFGIEYANYGILTRPGAVPAPWLGAWFGEWNWIVFLYSVLVVTPMVFPTGRTMSRGWLRILQVVLSIGAVMVVLAAFDQSLELEGTGRKIPSPIGTAFGSDPDDAGSFNSYLLPFVLASAVLGLVALVLRFRRSAGEEKLQMKWLTFGSCVSLATFAGGVVWDATTSRQAPQVIFAFGVAAIPLGAGVGILKYRLYDIDVIINRALVYATLTAILAVLYLGIVFGLQQVLPLDSESDVAVAASTLAVAGLFRPLRAGVQRFIDRRFYRSRYDSAEILARFGARLRDQVDFDNVKGDTLEVVATTVQPSHASIWLRTAT